MNHQRRDWRKAVLSLAFWLYVIPASAEDIPPGILTDWGFYNNAAWKCLNRGDYELAEERFNLAIKTIRPYFPDSRRLLARSYCDLARTLYHEGRYAEAQPLAEWALSVREADPKTSPEVLFQCTYALAVIHAAQAHYNDAEPLLKRAIAFQEKSIGEEHINMAVTLEMLACVYADMQRYTQAESLFRRVIAIRERTKPDENLELAQTAMNFAELFRRMRQPDEADKWESRAKAIQKNVADKARKARLDRTGAGFQGFK
ncbi:MAG: tetratricopeptide repeat protein [Isosphaeraceae bacterium]